MIEKYKPDYYLQAIYNLDVDTIHKLGIKLVLADLDNTLIAWNNPDGTPEMRQWLHDLKEANIKVAVVSNNQFQRVKRAVAPFGIDFVCNALKPFPFGILKAMRQFGGTKENTIIVGDQRMTDIHASKRAGIRSILVKPLIQSDHWSSQINRWRERRVSKKLEAKYSIPVYPDKIDL